MYFVYVYSRMFYFEFSSYIRILQHQEVTKLTAVAKKSEGVVAAVAAQIVRCMG